MKKRSLLLLEVTLGLTLLAAIIAILFHAMTRHAATSVQLEKMRSHVLERQHLQTRLSDLFLSIASEREAPFYTLLFPKEKKESLIFLFDNGIDPDPQFSGVILGRIFLDTKEETLVFATWPLDPNITPLPWRKETLCTHVKDIEFTYFGASSQEASEKNMTWQTHWPKLRNSSPLMIRLQLQQEWEQEGKGTASFAWSICGKKRA